MQIRRARMGDLDRVAVLAALLWPGDPPAERSADIERMAAREDAAYFLAEDDGRPVGFAECALRHDYVEGTDSSPVGYLEGVFVLETHRRRGVAKALVRACEAWAQGLGCKEFASDCLLENTQSIAFHKGAGFCEANRIVCFVKQLEDVAKEAKE